MGETELVERDPSVFSEQNPHAPQIPAVRGHRVWRLFTGGAGDEESVDKLRERDLLIQV